MKVFLPLFLTCIAVAQSTKLPFIRSNFEPQKTVGGNTYGSVWAPKCSTVQFYNRPLIISQNGSYTVIEADLYSNPCHKLKTVFQYTKSKTSASTEITLTIRTVKAVSAPTVCFSDALPWKNLTGFLEVFALDDKDEIKQAFPFLLEAGNDQVAVKFETKLKYVDIVKRSRLIKNDHPLEWRCSEIFSFGANICILDPTTLALESRNIYAPATRGIKHLKKNSYHSSVVNAFNEFSDTGMIEQYKPNDWAQLFKAAVEQEADKLEGISLSGLLSDNIEKNSQVNGWRSIISESCNWGDFICQVNNALPYNQTVTVVSMDKVLLPKDLTWPRII